MRSDKTRSTIFDDDFEVTYEEETSVFSDDETVYTPRRSSGRYADTYDRYDDSYDEVHEDWVDEASYDDGYDDYDTQLHGRRRRSSYDSNYSDRDGRSRETYDNYDTGTVRRRRRDSSVPLAAPIRKGGKALSRLSGALIRRLSALLILATMVYGAYNFWRGSALCGDLVEAFEKKDTTPVLAAYACVAAVFLLFELLSLFWAMTRTRVYDGFSSWKEDTGRGMFSFIAVFVSSYAAFLFNRFIPESPEILYGIKGALDVYGSLHNVLFGLCAAGVISCLVRKYSR